MQKEFSAPKKISEVNHDIAASLIYIATRNVFELKLTLVGWKLMTPKKIRVHLVLLSFVTSSVLSCAAQKRTARQDFVNEATRDSQIATKQEAISTVSVRKHIEFLASDQLEGRGTGSRGIDLAAGYIAGQFAAIGLEPGGDAGTYFQNFTVPSEAKISSKTRLTIKDRKDPLQLNTDFVPLSSSAESEFEGQVVFAGYGLTKSERQYDDYAGLDVKDKIVLAFRGQPPQWDAETAPRERTVFERKIARAAELGAAAILFVNTAPAGDGSDKLISFGRRGRPAAIPAMHIRRAIAEEILAEANKPTLTSLQEMLTRGEKAAFEISGVDVSGEVSLEREDLPARNVIGVLPGTGSMADQFVILGAHYDHLGVRDGVIYNGADDNASGSAAVIEVCKELAQVPVRERTIICMTFSGEEIGLLGSEHYVQHPTVPLASITAMVNIDMIGRWTPGVEANELAIQGLGTGDCFKRVIQCRAEEAGIHFLPDASAKGPSDHASFYEANIPSLFFFTGVHADYHRPGDDVEKVNVEGAAKIADLVSTITLDLLNVKERPQFAQVDTRPRIFRGPQPSGVVMGIVPDMEADSTERGWPIADVTEGMGAAKAGMKPGDRILSVAGQRISGLSDYYKATENKKPGDIVDVLVQRGKEELTLQVELSARP